MEVHTDDVRCRLREALEARDEIIFAYLHGSFAKGLPFHDVDVAVYLDPTVAVTTDIFDYEMELSVELTRTLRILVDVHVLNSAPLGFQHSILLRNLLVHRYWEVDPVRVLGYARENLGDFEAFLAAVESFVRQKM